MSLRIVYGRAGSGKTTFCLNDIKSNNEIDVNKPLLYIVPEQFSLQAERSLIRTLGAKGIMRAEVLSFRRMAYRVFSEVGGLQRRHLNAAGKSMLMHRVIESSRKDLRFFIRAATQKGFVKTAIDMVAELKRYDIAPAELETAAAALGGEPLKDKLSDISRIYAGFDEALHLRYMDSDDDLTELYKKLDDSKQFNGAQIWIDEFSGFTPQEYRVIERLLAKASRLTVCLCLDRLGNQDGEGRGMIFSTVGMTGEKLKRIAEDARIEIEKPVLLTGGTEGNSIRFKESRELGHLEKNLYCYPCKSFKGQITDISIFSASNPFSEVEETARDIIRLCRDKGMRYRDIAVVSRSLEKYEKLIVSVFKEYGIPCFIDNKRDITGHPLVVLILSALDIFKENWSYESVFRYAKTGLLNIDRESLDILENYILANGIRGKQWTNEEPWEYRPEPGRPESEPTELEQQQIDRINEARSKLCEPLMTFRSRARGRKKASEICTALFDLLCEIGIPQRIEAVIEELTSAGELDTAGEYRQVWNMVMEAFSQTVEVMGEDAVGLERFGEVLAAGLAEYKIGLIPPSLDQVTAGSVERSKSHEIKALYILGANDGVFPAAAFEEGILSDRERAKLKDLGVELAKDTRSRSLEERFLVYTALTTPSNYLRLSFPAADQDGRALRPSRVISDIRRIFPDIIEKSNVAGETVKGPSWELDLIAAPSPAFGELISVLGLRREGNMPGQVWSELYNWFSTSPAWRDKCKSIISGLSYTNQSGSIDTNRAVKLYGRPVYTSVSRMEAYSSCPFSYYIKYGMQARERSIFKLNPVDAGSFLHRILDEFSRMIVQNGISWRELDRAWSAEKVSGIVDKLLDSMKGSIFNSSKRHAHISQRLKNIAVRSVMLISEHIRRGGFEPSGYEVEFGENGRYPAIELQLPGGERLRLTGRIDRVDTLEKDDGVYIRIIDYKSGPKALKLSDVYYGLQLQLVTYMDAVLGMEQEDAAKKPGKPYLPGGVLYVRLDDPLIGASRESTPEEIETAIMKELKMKGLLLADARLVKEMDRQIDGESLIIPARMNKGDTLGRSSAISKEHFEMLRCHVRNTLIGLGSRMLDGNVRISPYKKKTVTACRYCAYSSVCQFDPAMHDNKYRVLNEIGDDEVLKLIGRDIS